MAPSKGTESNGDGALEPELGDIWPAEMDTVADSPPPPSSEEKAGLAAADPGEGVYVTEVAVVDNGIEERTPEEEEEEEEQRNCDRMSPQSQLEDSDADPAPLETIFIAPLDGSHAELRSQVIKEVRKPGRSESVQHSTLRSVSL